MALPKNIFKCYKVEKERSLTALVAGFTDSNLQQFSNNKSSYNIFLTLTLV